MMPNQYSDSERAAVYKVMRERRDVRHGYLPTEIPPDVLTRVLSAGHLAGSVGLVQPWDFLLLTSLETRTRILEHVASWRSEYARSLPPARAKQFKNIKIEAILDTPVNVVVTADISRGGRHVLGARTQPRAAPQSTDLAVQNIWLAARAEGLGVKPELVTLASSDRVAQLADHKVDLVISSLGKDAEREKLIDFSIAYAPFFSAVFGPVTLAVAKPEDLAGKTIAVTRDTVEDHALTRLAPAGAIIKRYDDNAATEVAFLASKTELVATGNVVASAILATNPPKKPTIKFLLQNSPCYVGINKGQSNLLARVDAIIAAALKDGSLSRISEHWLNAPLGDPAHPNWASVK